MIRYNTKRWANKTFVWQGTVLARIYPHLLAYGLWATTIYIISHWGFVVFPKFGVLAHSLVGVAMGMLLVFRTNSCYDRYWEGRKRWSQIITSSRNLLRTAAAHTGTLGPLPPLVHAFSVATMQELRHDKGMSNYKGILDDQAMERLAQCENRPLELAVQMGNWASKQAIEGNMLAPMARDLHQAIGVLLEDQEACIRIMTTPVPFAYAVQISQLLEIYLITLPVVMVPETDWMIIPVTFLIGFALLGIEEAGIEIEDPFGDDPNDLPLNEFCDRIRADAEQIKQSLVSS